MKHHNQLCTAAICSLAMVLTWSLCQLYRTTIPEPVIHQVKDEQTIQRVANIEHAMEILVKQSGDEGRTLCDYENRFQWLEKNCMKCHHPNHELRADRPTTKCECSPQEL
jgi:hypothetical protein